MSTFILIHGSWHGGWCWTPLVSLLETRGHRIDAPDLPGHGNDRTPFGEISLSSYLHAVENAVSACREPPILVAHSLAGMVVTALPPTALASVALIVCVTAYIPENGQSVMDLAQQDEPSLTRRHCIVAKDGLRLLLPRKIASRGIYSACARESVEWALPQLRPDPLGPNVEPVSYDRAALDRVKKYYVECTEDRAVSLDLQRRMQGRLHFERIFSLQSDHVPMISCPQKLAGILTHIAECSR